MSSRYIDFIKNYVDQLDRIYIDEEGNSQRNSRMYPQLIDILLMDEENEIRLYFDPEDETFIAKLYGTYLITYKFNKNKEEYILFNKVIENTDDLNEIQKRFYDFLQLYVKSFISGKYIPDENFNLIKEEPYSSDKALDLLSNYSMLTKDHQEEIIEKAQEKLCDKIKFRNADLIYNIFKKIHLPIAVLIGMGAFVITKGLILSVLIATCAGLILGFERKRRKSISDMVDRLYNQNFTTYEKTKAIKYLKIFNKNDNIRLSKDKKKKALTTNINNPIGTKLAPNTKVQYSPKFSTVIININENLSIADTVGLDLSNNIIQKLYIPKINGLLDNYEKLDREGTKLLEENLNLLNGELVNIIKKHETEIKLNQTTEVNVLNKIMKERIKAT